MSSTMMMWRPSSEPLRPMRFFTAPVDSVPSYEASLTNEISFVKSIFLIRSLRNMNEPFNTARKIGVSQSE